MKIAFITADETLHLRSLQLRDGWELERCRFDSDEIEGAFHLAQINDDEVVCVLSLHPQGYEGLQGEGFQLRGMATHPHYYKKGLGKSLIEFAIQDLKSKGVDYIWCNARRNAYLFYEKMGFKYMSDEFEIPTAGPHRKMYLLLSV
ncbi:GNAT family N-acetyltransferase [Albibacterium bauzanense]|uniref:Acetyltransferase (GNAT) family protein n=1 Tax=Albibacterium bauzanense TaxID=653929 RepID=A0A4R1LWI2_9SPHI|nr:GNAT family N-acetyltransferase [Albibacterium bauzanense]TCK83515.1 acetyltransferase (GNAT) family protein [Albibacterium bauzanense]